MNAPNPFAPPKADVQDIDTAADVDIDRLPVSGAWKLKFLLMRRAGGERMKLGSNVLAFLFGPLYYVAKGMWRKAIVLFAACAVAFIVLSLLMDIAGLGGFRSALGYGVAAVFSTRANIDYYKKMVLKQNGWW